MENKVIRYETQIQLVPSSMKQLNKQFALVDILLCYHGRNRNMTAMSKEVIEAALPSLYGIPIVGEYIYLDDGSQDFGSHGGKIIISDKGIKFEDTTKPYGFITKEAVDNAKWITITEKNGIQQHEYLELKNCIVWEKRYEEVSALLDKNYGQSMEIEISSGEYDSDGYYDIKEMTFSAACILGSNPDGTDVIPCFESACIGRHYELDSFKKEFALMLDEYKKFNESDGTSNTATTTVQNNATNNNPHMEGENKMDFVKITETLSKSDDNCKYKLLNATENKVFALDLATYKPYGFDYAVTKTDDSESIVIDFESKTEMSLSATDKISDENFDEFNIKNEIDTVKENYAKGLISENTKKISESLSIEFKQDYDKLKESYDTLSESYKLATDKLAVFEKKEAELKEKAHKEEIDNLVNTYAEKLGKYSKFLVYKAQIEEHYSKSVDEIRQDLIFMAGNYLTSQENSLKRNFSYTPTEAGVAGKRNETTNNKYGHLLDKYIK